MSKPEFINPNPKSQKRIVITGDDSAVADLCDILSDGDCNSAWYARKHRYCPNCGCCALGTTLMTRYGKEDDNRASCCCGWTGRVHDKVATRPAENVCKCKFCLRDHA